MDSLPALDAVASNEVPQDSTTVESPTFLDRLFDAGLLVRTGVDGLYGRQRRVRIRG